ncbi:hypothetical protein [uncultured Cohaesibacter sp.]|uniref:hypothetical protein n=1 Tax=uncultured Cohaesibacter sp. TaxID=1002546 RepID=UPI00292FE8D1|nr:hypothetical protein [uncultured Cohaesibacter sp.]
MTKESGGKSNVVSLDGGPVPQAGEVCQDVIETLQRMLSDARSGDLQGLFCVAYHADDSHSRWKAGVSGGYSTIGELKVMADDLSSAQLSV